MEPHKPESALSPSDPKDWTTAELLQLKSDVMHWGQELGFQQLGVSGIQLEEHEKHLLDWLAQGMHGKMEYMERHGTRRSRPQELIPGTLRVISARMDYLPEQAQSAEEEAGSLKTRSAAAEVKQAVMMEELSSERRKAARMFAGLKKEFQEAEKRQGEEMTLIQERKRMLEIELNEVKNELEKKEREAKQKALEMEER